MFSLDTGYIQHLLPVYKVYISLRGAMESEGPPGLLLWPLLKVCHMKGPREKEENHRYTTHLSLGSSKP